MRSVNVFIALLFGYIIATVSSKDGADYTFNDKIVAGERTPSSLPSKLFEGVASKVFYAIVDQSGS